MSRHFLKKEDILKRKERRLPSRAIFFLFHVYPGA